MPIQKTIGFLLIASVIGIFIPYVSLMFLFDYPQILRQDAGGILTAFNQGGGSLIFNWWAFAILGLPLLIAYILIGQLLESRIGFMRWVTIVGVISVLAQMIGLLRWVFVVPTLAESYAGSNNPITREATIICFQMLNQSGGVLMGEHIGQLFTVIWTFMISVAFIRLKLLPGWVSLMGIFSAFIYFLAQAELFATVIPGFPFWESAGLIGSTLWLVWLMITGIYFLKRKLII